MRSHIVVNNPLFGNPDVGGDARYSPAANQIVFLAQAGSWSPSYDLYLANADGSNPRVFFEDAADNTMDRHPIWSRDGQTVYWARPGSSGVNHDFGIVRRALSSASSTSVYDAVVWPYAGVTAMPQATSPDDRSLLVSLGDGRLVLMNLTSGDTQTLAQFASMGDADWGQEVALPFSIAGSSLVVNGGNQQLIFAIPTQVGKNYQVLSSTNLSQSIWIPVEAARSGTGGMLRFTNSVGSYQQRFFRVAELP